MTQDEAARRLTEALEHVKAVQQAAEPGRLRTGLVDVADRLNTMRHSAASAKRI